MEGARRDFVGRRWVMERLDEWLNSSGRFFHLVGEPGSGKTALSRQLVHLASATSEDNADFPSIRTGFIDASHFCSARDRRMVNPITFAESLGSQLAKQSQVYTNAMLKAIGAQPNVVKQRVESAENSTVIGVLIEELNARGPSPEDAFNRLVREPLEALCRAEPARMIVILVDALDESLAYRGDVGIVPLLAQADDLPAQIRFVLTSRPVPEIERKLAAASGSVERLTLSAVEWDAHNRDDIAAYIASRFTSDDAIAPRVAAVDAATSKGAAAEINARAGGNFLYARFLLDAVGNGQWKLEELATAKTAVPSSEARGMDTLYQLYMQSLERVIEQGKGDWQTDYAPLMESLSAAQETLPRERLRTFAGQKETAFR
ncbi:MAG: AAA family ATPase, partial [Gemmatimonas sp.]